MSNCDTCIHWKVCPYPRPDENEDCVNFEEERPQGEWIYKKFDEKTGISDSYFCSCCNFPLTGIYKFYCAACGADMRKDGDDEW